MTDWLLLVCSIVAIAVGFVVSRRAFSSLFYTESGVITGHLMNRIVTLVAPNKDGVQVWKCQRHV